MKVILALLFFFNSLESFSQAKEERIVPRAKLVSVKSVKVGLGDSFFAKIILWPREAYSLNFLSSLEGRFINNTFFLSKIQGMEASENNREAITLRALVVVAAPKQITPKNSWTINEEVIETRLQGIETDLTGKIKPEYVYANQDHDEEIHLGIILFCSLLILLLGLMGFRHYQLAKKKIPKESINKKEWIEILGQAQSRNDFEMIYIKKNEWTPLFAEVPRVSREKFFTTLNEHQYKPDWKEEDLKAVRETLQKIVGKIE